MHQSTKTHRVRSCIKVDVLHLCLLRYHIKVAMIGGFFLTLLAACVNIKCLCVLCNPHEHIDHARKHDRAFWFRTRRDSNFSSRYGAMSCTQQVYRSSRWKRYRYSSTDRQQKKESEDRTKSPGDAKRCGGVCSWTLCTHALSSSPTRCCFQTVTLGRITHHQKGVVSRRRRFLVSLRYPSLRTYSLTCWLDLRR